MKGRPPESPSRPTDLLVIYKLLSVRVFETRVKIGNVKIV
jgi:hypothetical protein